MRKDKFINLSINQYIRQSSYLELSKTNKICLISITIIVCDDLKLSKAINNQKPERMSMSLVILSRSSTKLPNFLTQQDGGGKVDVVAGEWMELEG